MLWLLTHEFQITKSLLRARNGKKVRYIEERNSQRGYLLSCTVKSLDFNSCQAHTTVQSGRFWVRFSHSERTCSPSEADLNQSTARRCPSVKVYASWSDHRYEPLITPNKFYMNIIQQLHWFMACHNQVFAEIILKCGVSVIILLLPVESEAPWSQMMKIKHVWYLWFQVGPPPVEYPE